MSLGANPNPYRANDKEDERMQYESVLSERALREIYLMPFMLAQKYAQPWAVMTAYVEDLSPRRSAISWS